MNTRLMMMYRSGSKKPWRMWHRVTHKGEIIEDLNCQDFKTQTDAIQAARKLALTPPIAWKQAAGGDLWVGPRIIQEKGGR